MRRIVRAGAALALLFTGCETTGNPRQGGLFGWSESKAQQRQSQHRDQLASAEAKLHGEHQRGASLRSQNDAASRQQASAEAEARATTSRLRARETALATKAAQLETMSPTAATASRARRLRMEVEAVLADRGITPTTRARQLRELEAEIDAASANLNR